MVYALKIPKTSFTLFGAIPKPVQAPAAVVFEEVTKGYVPKSTSNKEPCAPSAKIDLKVFPYRYIFTGGNQIKTGQAIFSKFPIIDQGNIVFPNSKGVPYLMI